MKKLLFIIFIISFISCENSDNKTDNQINIPEDVSINEVIKALEAGDSLYHNKRVTVKGYLRIKQGGQVCDAMYYCESSNSNCEYQDTNVFLVRNDYHCPWTIYGIHDTENEYEDEINLILRDKVNVRSRDIFLKDYPRIVSGILLYSCALDYKNQFRHRSANLVLDSISTDLVINHVPSREK